MTASPPFFCNTLCHLGERFSARTPFSRLSKEEKENGGWAGIKNKSLKPQDVASLASIKASVLSEDNISRPNREEKEILAGCFPVDAEIF